LIEQEADENYRLKSDPLWKAAGSAPALILPPKDSTMELLLLPLLAAIAGFAVTLQGQFMGLMDRALGTRESVFITYVSGGLLVALFVLLTGRLNLKTQAGLPWYAFTSGILGLVIVGSIGYVVPRLGAARGFTIILACQFLLAALIDHLGLFGATRRALDLTNVFGLAVMLGGVWLVVRD
jgi:transporter family-2 protein